jgi:hypothetical protein
MVATSRSWTAQPDTESGLAEDRFVAGNQAALVRFGAEVARLRVSDDFTRIVPRRQALPDEFVETELFGTGGSRTVLPSVAASAILWMNSKNCRVRVQEIAGRGLEELQYRHVLGLFDDIDSMEPDAFARHLADDVRFVFGNSEAVIGRGPATIVESTVTYTRQDSTTVSLPAVTIYRSGGDLIEDYRIFMDVAPLFTG